MKLLKFPKTNFWNSQTALTPTWQKCTSATKPQNAAYIPIWFNLGLTDSPFPAEFSLAASNFCQ
jgi:hypothetical protein